MALFNNCSNRYDCVGVALVASIIVGIITAFLRITGVITVTPVFLFITLGIAVVYLAGLLLSAALTHKNGCCTSLAALLIGILGTVLLSVVLLAIPFAATSIVGAIITGLLLAFVTLIFTATACLIRCLANCNN